MRKFLLSLVAFVAVALTASAAEVTFDFKTNSYGLTPYTDANTAYIKNGDKAVNGAVSIELNGSAKEAWRMWSDGLRAYGKSASKAPYMVVTAGGNNITNITITYLDGSTYALPEGQSGTWTGATTSGTWAGDAPSVRLNFTAAINKCAAVTLTVTYTEGAAAVAMPTISYDNNMVTITAEEGADIYYTVDGTTPTTASTKYSAPFAITANTTVKAIAVKNGVSSLAASKDCAFVGTYAGYAAFLATKPTAGTQANITGPITAIYQNGRYIYTKDSQGAYLPLYNSAGFTDVTTVNGTQFATISGSYSEYGKAPQMTNIVFGAQSQGTAVEPEVVALEEIGLTDCGRYVKIAGCTITAAARANNYDLTDGTATVVMYNTFNNPDNCTVVDVPTGDNFTVTGFVNQYNGTLQLQPVAFEGGKVVEQAETPVFSPAGGQIAQGSTVEITSATAGAAIFYTLDGTEPSAASTEYTAPIAINADCTIKAIAVKEGMTNSFVASATFSVIAAGTEVATFDFGAEGNAKSLTSAAIEASNGSKETDSNNIENVHFTNGVVTMWIDKTSGINPRWWLANNGSEMRFYNGNTLHISVNTNGYKITEINMAKGTGSNFDTTKATVTPAGGTWNERIWTAPADAVVVNFDMAVTATFNVGSVNVSYVKDASAMSGVESIAAENAAAEYFTLQGVRVAAPTTPGLYIVRQGNKVSKTVIR